MGDRHSSAIPRLLFRALLRWARQHQDLPLSVRTSDIATLIPPEVVRGTTLSLRGSELVTNTTKWIFREQRTLSGPAAREAIDRGLDALRVLNTEYAAAAQEMRATRAARTDRNGISFRIGQVFVHRRFGYRGVIYGWDRRCERDSEWAAQMGVDPSMPHYYVLPDEHDCQRLFGGVRLTKYVCEDNMLPVEEVTVVHRALGNYFIGYSNQLHRYIPVRKLQFEYPDTYTASAAGLRPAAEDSNLLLHDDFDARSPHEKEKGALGNEHAKAQAKGSVG